MKREKQTKRTNSVQHQPSELNVEQFPSSNSDGTTHSQIGENIMSTMTTNETSKKFDFNSLAVAEKQQSLDDHAEYQKVLREIARDECTRSEAEILRLLERCGRDTSDLKADVEWRTKRDTQIAEVKREQEYRTQNEELLAKLKVLHTEFEAVEAEYNEKRYPIIRERGQLDDKLRKISSYRYELSQTSRDANLELEIETLESSLDDRIEQHLYKQHNEIRDEISNLEHKLEHLPITADRRDRAAAVNRDIKRLKEEMQQIEVKKVEFSRKKDENKAAVAALREKLILS